MRLNIFYTITDFFVPQLGAAICSVCENNRNVNELVFYIGELNVTREHQSQLSSLAGSYGRDIHFISVDHLQDRIGFSVDTRGWNEVTLARLLVGQLLPQDIDRVIYLDGDTIVLGCLQELWETDMGDCAIGASIEPTANKKRRQDLGLQDLPYINAGVLLINLQKWRNENVMKQILDFYEARKGNLFASDQDAINGAMAGRIFYISPKYNYYNIFWYYPWRILVRLQRPARYLDEATFKAACNDPRIIHFLGEDRPWRKGNTHRYSADYHKYLSMTIWKDTPMEEGWELYFRFYKAFWVILKPFPLLQYHIIDNLIPLVMKWRKKARLKKEKAI